VRALGAYTAPSARISRTPPQFATVIAQLARPRFCRYCWWYSSAGQNTGAGVISVTIGLLNRACAASFDAFAFASCSGEWKKIAERYWSPTSGPCRLSWVGSCSCQKASSRSS
jgi:hypothetical protein